MLRYTIYVEYQIPQFIEVEDKIFGPFTFKQFIFIAGGAGICILLFLKLNIILAVLLSIPVAGFAGTLAFYKVNNKSFLSILEAAFSHYTKGRMYLWRRDEKAAAPDKAKELSVAEALAQQKDAPFKALTRGRLEEIARALDADRP